MNFDLSRLISHKGSHQASHHPKEHQSGKPKLNVGRRRDLHGGRSLAVSTSCRTYVGAQNRMIFIGLIFTCVRRSELVSAEDRPPSLISTETLEMARELSTNSPRTTLLSTFSTLQSATPSALLRSEIVWLPWSIAPERQPRAQSLLRSFLTRTMDTTPRDDPRLRDSE